MMKSLAIFILLVTMVIPVQAEYIDSTANLNVNVPTNIYSLVGGTWVSGFEWFVHFAENSWGGFEDDIGGKNGYDSVYVRTDRSPTLDENWAYYSNPTQMNHGDLLHSCMIAICDSLITAGYPSDIFERGFIHVADDSVSMTYSSETRVVEGGTDSTHRFPLQVWGNSCPSSPYCPTGTEWLTDLVWDTGSTIIALAMKKAGDSAQILLGLSNPVKCIGWDNMLIGASASGCYGVNQNSYWEPNLNNSWGGSYPSDVEWDNIGRALVTEDYCDLKQGYFDVFEKTVDLYDGTYRLVLNISNTPHFNAKGYAVNAHDSVGHFGMELRGVDLLYYPYSDANFQLILMTMDTVRYYAARARVNIEYRMVTSKYDDRDVYNPGSSGTQTIRWGEWTSERAFACQLCIQYWDSTAGQPLTCFSYGRPIFTGGKNDRWYRLFSTDLGGPAGMRQDSVKSGYTVMVRKYLKGVSIYRPPATSGGDTTATTVSIDLGEPVYWIQSDSTQAVDSTYDADGVVTVKSNYGYTFLYESGEPPAEGGKKLRGIRK